MCSSSILVFLPLICIFLSTSLVCIISCFVFSEIIGFIQFFCFSNLCIWWRSAYTSTKLAMMPTWCLQCWGWTNIAKQCNCHPYCWNLLNYIHGLENFLEATWVSSFVKTGSGWTAETLSYDWSTHASSLDMCKIIGIYCCGYYIVNCQINIGISFQRDIIF